MTDPGGHDGGGATERWALPEEAPAPEPTNPASSFSGFQTVRSPDEDGAAVAVRPVPVLPVFERPLTTADILDGAFQIIKARPRVIIGIAAVVVLPFGLIVAIVDFGALGGEAILALTDPDTFDEGPSSDGADFSFGALVISALITSALVTVMAAPISRVVEAWYLGKELTVLQAIRGVGWHWLTVVVAWVLAHLLQGIGWVFVMALMLPLTPIVVVERIGPFAAVARSFRLVRRRYWPTMWVAILAAVVAASLEVALPLMPAAIVTLVGAGGQQYVAGAGAVAASLLTFPFGAGVAVMVYFDLRVRTEGLDLQLAAASHFAETDS